MHVLHKNKTTDIAPQTDDTKMTRTYRNPYDWFEDMDRWFDDLSHNLLGWGPSPSTPRSEETPVGVRRPLVDLVDNGSEFLVRAELPGVSKGDVELSVTPDGIELKAETKRQREETQNDYCYRERSYSALQRALSFPEEVVPDLAEASLEDGLLEVRVPKREPKAEKEAVKVRIE
jgi:HSP20 family protein